MAIPDADRPLRAIQLLALIPTLALTTATTIVLHHAYFATITVPVGFSALLAIILLHPSAKPGRWTIFLDFSLACILFGMLVAYWVGLNGRWGYSWNNSAYILGTFGSVFPLLNFCIHAYFALRPTLPAILAYLGASFGTRTCPHCLREIRTTDPRLMWDFSSNGGSRGGSARSSAVNERDAKGQYEDVPADVPGEEAEDSTTPRASTDDEMARLV